MVIDHIQNHSEACLVERLNHLLELLDTGHRIVWIRRERAFHRIIVKRLIPPVVLIVFQTGLIYRREIRGRK